MFYGLFQNHIQNFPDVTKWELKNVIEYEYIFSDIIIKYEFNKNKKKLHISKA